MDREVCSPDSISCHGQDTPACHAFGLQSSDCTSARSYCKHSAWIAGSGRLLIAGLIEAISSKASLHMLSVLVYASWSHSYGSDATTRPLHINYRECSRMLMDDL